MFLSIFLCGISCKKNSEPPKKFGSCNVSMELKEWGLYSVGSYWIYKDSITGIFDSVYVESVISSRWRRNTKDSIISEEQIKVNLGSTNGFSNYTLDSHGGIIGENNAMVFNLDTVIPLYSQIRDNFNISLLNVLGQNYSQVRYLYIFQQNSANSSAYIITEKNYMKKYVGIIKRLANQNITGGFNQNLELVRYNVSQ